MRNGRDKVGIKKPKGFIDYSQTDDDLYENLEDDNLTKKRRMFIEFDDMIPVIEPTKKLSPFVIELFLTGKKLNISLAFKVLKTIRLNAAHCFIMKIPNKRKLQIFHLTFDFKG